MNTTYRVVRLLGIGGTGRVYEAVREIGLGAGRRVAVKVLDQQRADAKTLERFRDEARILSLARDRAVVWADVPVRLVDGWAVVMDLAPGVNAWQLHKAIGAMPPPAAVEIVGEVARALNNLWQLETPDGPLRVIHRDLKPSNLQISRSGEVRILDFGNARAEFAAREARTTRHIGGTPGYIAPERLAGVDGPEGDVYSLGVVLRELVSTPLASPTPRRTPRTVGANDLEPATAAPVPLDASIPREVSELVASMTARNPVQRPTAQQITRRCRELLRALPGEALADWTERAVPAAGVELTPDERVGTVLVVARATDQPT